MGKSYTKLENLLPGVTIGRFAHSRFVYVRLYDKNTSWKELDLEDRSGSFTTAEAIAAELAAAAAARPAVTYTTFAPGNLAPGGGLRQRSRRSGAVLKSFRGIAQDLFKS